MDKTRNTQGVWVKFIQKENYLKSYEKILIYFIIL